MPRLRSKPVSALLLLGLFASPVAYVHAQQPPAPVQREAPAVPPSAGAYPASPDASPSEPAGVPQALAELTSQPAAHTAFTFDRDTLQSMLGAQAAALNSVTVQNFRYREPAFYVPEALAALGASYNAAGWKHLVEAHVSPRQQATPEKPITDIWLHYHSMEIDDVAVLIRAPKQMNLIEVSGMLRPLDLAHLAGHFGIPRVDPGAVMVPAPPGQ